MYLHWGGVGAQHVLRIDVEGIVHRTGRMVFRYIQCSEVVEVAFDFRTGCSRKAERMEQLLDAFHRTRDRM